VAEHKADGTYRADRHGTLDVTVEIPEPGHSLSPRARVIYDGLAQQLLEWGIVTALDSIALTEAASCTAELERCRLELNRSELIVEGKSNPLCGTINQLRNSLYKYLTQLGLTPRSRTGIDVQAKVADPLDAFD